MLIPIGHEQMSSRRWPVITFFLIAVNVCAFLGTFEAIEKQGAQLGKTKAHILLLAAMHPDLRVPAPAQSMVTKFRDVNPSLWNKIQQPNREVVDEWDAKERLVDDADTLQADMDSLGRDYVQQSAESVTEQYAFVPASPKPIAYLTANFLHGGWLHLIGNMWFLWLAGFVLEDVWGRVTYTLVYLLAGAAALQFHAWMYPGSIVPTLGASGAVAALMGAFLVRFPRMKIHMAWLFRFRLYKFKMAAYWLLPLWLLMEIFYGSVLGSSSGVAHWAHVGGFGFGALVALGLRFSGLEHKLNQAIESKVSLAADPEITQAGDQLAAGHYDVAISTLQQYTNTHPSSTDGWLLLQQAYRAKGDLPAFCEAAIKCCQSHLKAREPELALQNYEDFVGAGGNSAALPAATWLELCRAAEGLHQYERALAEFERLASAYPDQPQSLQAQLGAGRCAQRLNRPQDALKFYEAASASRVPHLDLETTINAGIRQAKAALNGATQTASAR
jgi:membrane associated rhomboid family serine protease